MLKIRLRRMGNRNRPFYRIVVSDSRRRPTSSAIEEVGYYDAIKDPAILEVKRERVQYWVDRGAQMSDTLAHLLKSAPPEQVTEQVTEKVTEQAAAEA